MLIELTPRSRQLESRLNSLGDDELRRFYSLTDAFKRKKSEPNGHAKAGKTNFGIVKTNSFTVARRRRQSDVENGTMQSVLALFPSIARGTIQWKNFGFEKWIEILFSYLDMSKLPFFVGNLKPKPKLFFKLKLKPKFFH